MARALELPMYQLFYYWGSTPSNPMLPEGLSADSDEWAEPDRKLIMHMTFQMVRKKRP